MTKRETSTLVPAMGLFLVAVLLCYVGSYFVLVEIVHAKRPWGQDRVASVFQPVHRLDRKLRPAYWHDRDSQFVLYIDVVESAAVTDVGESLRRYQQRSIRKR